MQSPLVVDGTWGAGRPGAGKAGSGPSQCAFGQSWTLDEALPWGTLAPGGGDQEVDFGAQESLGVLGWRWHPMMSRASLYKLHTSEGQPQFLRGTRSLHLPPGCWGSRRSTGKGQRVQICLKDSQKPRLLGTTAGRQLRCLSHCVGSRPGSCSWFQLLVNAVTASGSRK